jgi:hypothetical protein
MGRGGVGASTVAVHVDALVRLLQAVFLGLLDFRQLLLHLLVHAMPQAKATTPQLFFAAHLEPSRVSQLRGGSSGGNDGGSSGAAAAAATKVPMPATTADLRPLSHVMCFCR